jgi:predicted enzyme related to lactoylglutathione lyase
MSERREYAPGEFCWVDLATTDLEAAKAFYTDVLGVDWQVAPGPPEATGGYGFLVKDGKPVAGIGPVREEVDSPAWSSYVKVEDADATAERVRSAGGQVLAGPMDLPNESGRAAVCQDPTSAVICIYQQQRHRGAELVNEPGTWTWTNLLTRDIERVQDFYGQVFGWTATQPEGAPDFIWNWQVEGQRWPEGLAGLMRIGTDMPPNAPPYWQVYLMVEDVDQAVEKTKAAGGRLIFGPLDTPIARIATVFDPQGASVSLLESRYPEPR